MTRNPDHDREYWEWQEGGEYLKSAEEEVNADDDQTQPNEGDYMEGVLEKGNNDDSATLPKEGDNQTNMRWEGNTDIPSPRVEHCWE